MIKDFPEAIYYPLTDEDFNGRQAAELSARHTSTLIGSGSGISRELYEMTEKLITAEGGPLVLDADAINSLARFGSAELLKKAKRRVILTPHPMEFSRISGISTEEINSARIKVAREFAKEHNCILVLKGAGTVITDGERVFINSSGSSALAKGGSGDALSGLMVSLLAFLRDPLEAAAAAVYIHGAAGDKLAEEYSEYGVTPSDLPKEMARVFLKIGRTEK
jgi:NAD(P)H-hydrate epimerase